MLNRFAIALLSSLRAQRSNPEPKAQSLLDCRVANAPRNDGFVAGLLVCLFIAFPTTTFAQDLINPSKDEPIEITADDSLEWLRNEKIFVARTNAVAKQGDVSVAAQTLTANYRETSQSNMEIYRVTAADQVVIHSRENTAYGEQAVYDVDRGVAVMTGNNLRMKSPDQIVYARDNFEYWVTDGRLIANGDARVERLDDTLEADKIIATLSKNTSGPRNVETVEASGNVVIRTPSEIVTGAHGIYHASTNMAELTGGVTVRRGPNTLEGERAEVDMNTNVSRIFGGARGEKPGRVRGVFFPGTTERPAE